MKANSQILCQSIIFKHGIAIYNYAKATYRLLLWISIQNWGVGRLFISEIKKIAKLNSDLNHPKLPLLLMA